MTTDSFSAENAVWAQVKLPPWWLVLIEGILLIIIGGFLLFSPFRSFVSIIWVMGIFWLVRGVMDLVSLIWDRSMWGWKIIAGLLGIAAGWIVIQHPLGSSVVIGSVTVWMLAFIGIFMGISSLIRAFQGAGWGTGILGGISIALGILLLFNTAVAAATLPWVMGFFAIFGGIASIFGAFRVRSAQKTLDEVAQARLQA
jgi:uncharacterized membrane protein HdeD (DUF308 family)